MAQVILVTGSASGFGRLIVETLACQGSIVFAGMRAVAGKNAPAADVAFLLPMTTSLRNVCRPNDGQMMGK